MAMAATVAAAIGVCVRPVSAQAAKTAQTPKTAETARTAQTAKAAQPAKVRIGVFDSRAVAFAYYRSDEFQKVMKDLNAEHAKAKAAHDEKRAKALEKEGEWSQVRTHQRVFSTGPVSDLLAKVKGQLAVIAKQERVSVIVSKWEVQFGDPAAELVDVTLPVAKLLNPSADVLRFVEETKEQAPVPFDQLGLDPRQ
jgi:hypothetical protein